ncbi:helix-turn-helix domain-containing protein [Bacillus cereus]|uniref:helix-turn-helix domain-containing protein n=1 Tax=Bacillus cereus TaxID=1396 RepID=UPI003D174E9F
MAFKLSKEELQKLYVEDGLSDNRIAELKGTNTTMIRRLRVKYEIESRGSQGVTPTEVLSKTELERLYIKEGLSDKQIGRQVGLSHSTVHRLRKKYEIEARPPKRAFTEEELKQLYLVEGKTDEQIAKSRGITAVAVAYLRKVYGIEAIERAIVSEETLLDLYVKQKMTDKEIAKRFGCSERTVSGLRKRFGIQANRKRCSLTKEQVYNLYVEKGLSDNQIADLFNTYSAVISRLRERYGIQTRKVITDQSLPYVYNILMQMGFKVENMRQHTHMSFFDFLLNGRIRIDVRTSTTFYNNNLNFKLLDRDKSDYEVSDIRLKMDSGRTKRNIRNTCDYVICVGYIKEKPHCWVIPSRDLKEDLQGITIRPYSERSKYNFYAEAWHLIK